LDADLVKGKGCFGEEKHERKKGQLEGKSACKEDLMMLVLLFFKCIVMDDETRI